MSPASAAAGLVHEALFYQEPAEYVHGIRRFLLEGLELSEPGLVAVPGEQLGMLRSALGSAALRVRFVDMAEVGRNPGRIIPTLLYAFAQEHSATRVRIVGQPIWPGRTSAEYRAALQHEALINIALADQTVTVLCPYDRCGLSVSALADARRTHPVLVEGELRELSQDYADPKTIADACLRELPEPPEWWGDMLVFNHASDLRVVRQFVTDRAVRAGLPSTRVSDLCLAVNEVATNTLLHTGEGGLISMWRDADTECLVCEIRDSGRFADRLVGRIPPAKSEAHGRGLFLVNQLCDLVELPTGQVDSGTTLRLHMALRA